MKSSIIRRAFGIATLMMLCISASTSFADYDEAKYWVVGSFSQLGSAISESRRIEDLTGATVEVARFEMPQGVLYRIVIPEGANPQAQKQSLIDVGAEPWIVPVAGGDLNIVQLSKEGTDIEFSLVVGAFSKPERAEAFAADMNERGSETAQILTSDGFGVYRVAIGPYRYRKPAAEEAAQELGVEGAWWIVQEVAVIAPEPEPIMEPQPVVTYEAPEPKPIRPPGPNDRYVDYCVNKAFPAERKIYCQNEHFAAAAVAEERIKEISGGMKPADFCENKATRSQRKKYCQNLTFAELASPE